MNKQSGFFHAAWVVTLAYFLRAAVSVGCFLIGIRYNGILLEIGKFLFMTWMINPAAFIFLLIGLIADRPKMRYVACMTATIICWITAGALIAPYF